MSVRFGTPQIPFATAAPGHRLAALLAQHHLAEAAEEVAGVVRTRRRLGVVLHREDRARRVGESLDGAVVQVHVRDLDRLAGGAQRLGVDRVAVVLGADRDLLRREVLPGLVAAVMAELQLLRLAAEREAEDLVAEADAEDRQAAVGELAHDRPHAFDRRGIAGAVREEHGVGLVARATSAADVCAGTTVTSKPCSTSRRRMLRFTP